MKCISAMHPTAAKLRDAACVGVLSGEEDLFKRGSGVLF